MPTVYVYPFPPALTGEHLYDNISAGDHDYHFRGELELTMRFREMPQADPSTADMLLVPFMLTQAFTKLRKGRNSPGHAQLRAWNDQVVQAMRSLGPWWDSKRTAAREPRISLSSCHLTPASLPFYTHGLANVPSH